MYFVVECQTMSTPQSSGRLQRIRGDVRAHERDWGCARLLCRRTVCSWRIHYGSLLAGIRPVDAPGFIAAQLAGAIAATVLFRWLVPSLPKDASAIVVFHAGSGEAKL
jgi:hypothetical protein